MILSNPKAPLVFGMAMTGFLAVYLTLRHPTPGTLAAPHAEAIGGGKADLPTCTVCHADEGLAQGCLDCHVEIAAQIGSNEGYHAFVLRGKEVTCAECHSDHFGREFPLVSGLSWGVNDPNLFDHPHVQFTLEGAHEGLACEACHRRSEAFTLPGFPSQPRRFSYLGLTQDCADCHEDVHAGALARSCERCHSQEAFRPAVQFDHDDYYRLEGAHARATCTACHPPAIRESGLESPVADVNDMRVVFDRVKGTACADCHESPHRTPWSGDCTTCHLAADETWAKGSRGIQPPVHALTGFPLDEAHAAVACAKCHASELSYGRRYPDPSGPGYRRHSQMCEGCHEDPHGGLFLGRYSACIDCHAPGRFRPAQFDVARHADIYPLIGLHATAECVACHPVDPNGGVRRFASEPRQCDACHADPHEGQFRSRHAQCTDCHDQERFLPAQYDAARHEALYPLTGAHAAVPCIRCHIQVGDAPVRRFVSTPRRCKDCHTDEHAGQFEREMAEGDCTICHRQDAATFGIQPYDHVRQAGYPLSGAHGKAKCADCHRVQEVGSPSGSVRRTRTYRGTPAACDACHADLHRGQFVEDERQDCERCHGSTENWTANRFDHDRVARFKLEGAHADLACSACHPSVRQPDGQDVIQYRPLPRRCEDCHGFTPD